AGGPASRRSAAHSAGYRMYSRQRCSASPCPPHSRGGPSGIRDPVGDRHPWPLTTIFLRSHLTASYNKYATKKPQNCHAIVMWSCLVGPTLHVCGPELFSNPPVRPSMKHCTATRQERRCAMNMIRVRIALLVAAVVGVAAIIGLSASRVDADPTQIATAWI